MHPFRPLKNQLQLEMREMLVRLSGTIFEDLEKVLSLRYRGCSGVHLNKANLNELRRMKNDIGQLHILITHERSDAEA